MLLHLTETLSIALAGMALLMPIMTYLHMLRKVQHRLFQNMFLFGKLYRHQKSILAVPKGWFSHFYVVSIATTLTLIFLVPCSLETCLLLSITMCNAVRRLYECSYVYVKSESTISIFHYLAGVLFYFVLPLSIITDTSSESFEQPSWLRWSISLVCIAIIQHLAHIAISQLADVRKTGKKPLRNTYGEPSGCMFNHFSCPHYLLEITYYTVLFSLVAQFSTHAYFLRLWLFVIINQACSVLVTHQWYCENLPNWAASRARFVPKLF
ncbi:hypothetical protein Ciccas_005754 [Cichlidogyrus casuarinus]|uniref:Polyprenal reductase n=1 Tax=Cichlidogyrus casuarinus TaxID=1844966 RepID=A0ABD2Q7T4_9PLAT